MKSFIVVALFVAAAVAAPLTPDGDAQIVELRSDNIGVDGYSFGLKTSNGIDIAEEGSLADAGTENEGIEVRGQFSYVGPDGVTYTVQYTAGRDGFRPIGNHLPVAA